MQIKEVMGKCAYITLSTSTKNYEAILKLYTKELVWFFTVHFLLKKPKSPAMGRLTVIFIK